MGEGADAAAPKPRDVPAREDAHTRRAEPTGKGKRTENRPWEAERVRDDVVKGYALRLPEPLYLKMKWVASERGQSMNELCRGAIEDVVEAHLRDSA